MTKVRTDDGITCWTGGDSRRPCITIYRYKGEHYEAFMGRAGRDGWCIGHNRSEAHYVCPDCRESVFEPVPLNDLRHA